MSTQIPPDGINHEILGTENLFGLVVPLIARSAAPVCCPHLPLLLSDPRASSFHYTPHPRLTRSIPFENTTRILKYKNTATPPSETTNPHQSPAGPIPDRNP